MSDTAVASNEVHIDWGKRRKITFYMAVGLSLASMVITGPLLTLPVTAWFPEATLDAMFGEERLGIHRVHMEGAALLFWMTIVAMVAQIRRPERRAAPLWAAAAAWVVFLPLEFTHLVDPYSIIVTVLVLAVLVLHPRRWPTTPIEWRIGSRLMAIPFAVVAVAYSYQQAMLQLNAGPGDPHAVASHYELMVGMAVGLAVSSLFGATNFPGGMISAWIVGLMTPILGVFFIGHPSQTSSAGAVWGSALLGWGLIYLLVSRRSPRVVDSEPARASR